MSDNRDGPDAGGIIAGIFLILFGLCLTLLGGGCTAMFFFSAGGIGSSSEMWTMMPLVLIALITLGAGIALIWLGIKLMTGGFRK
jgi:hypothetical protein